MISTYWLLRAKFVLQDDTGTEHFLLTLPPEQFVQAAQACGVYLEEGQTSFEAHENLDGTSECLTVVSQGAPLLPELAF